MKTYYITAIRYNSNSSHISHILLHEYATFNARLTKRRHCSQKKLTLLNNLLLCQIKI